MGQSPYKRTGSRSIMDNKTPDQHEQAVSRRTLLGTSLAAGAVAATAGFAGGRISNRSSATPAIGGGEFSGPEYAVNAKTIGLLLFDGAEELDFAGPWEVFGAWSTFFPEDRYRAVSISLASQQVRCAQGLDVRAQYTHDAAPSLDIVLVPGGKGWRKLINEPESIAKVRKLTESVELVTSVCTGALLLAKAGLLKNRRATTHWRELDTLFKLDPSITVDRDSRYVEDGAYITSSGVSAGIDMALYLVSKLTSTSRANEVAHAIQYTHQWQTSKSPASAQR